MIALFRLMALFTNTLKLTETTNNNLTSVQNNNSCYPTRAVVVFSHHRDLKVALDELHHAGFSNDWITLITRNTKHCSWCSEFITKNYFDAEKFDFNQVAQKFFWQLFQRGKYLVLLSGNGYDVDAASKIMSRRQDHAKVWHFE
jgi:hypothetical protein